MLYTGTLSKSVIGKKKSTLEWLCIVFLLLFSFVNSITLLISLVLLLTLLTQKEIGAIKIINIITLRTIMNPGVAVDIGIWQNVKWAILFGCSIYLLCSYLKLDNNRLNKIKWISIFIIIFTIYNFFVSLIFSSLPIVAIFKSISFVLIFLGTLFGVGYTYDKFDWMKWLLKIFQLLFIASFISIPLHNISYLKNPMSFQGLTNQPNMFGIIAVLFFAILLAYSQLNKYKRSNLLFYISITMSMVILSRSRTALISCSVLLLFYTVFRNYKKMTNLKMVVFSIIGIVLILFRNEIIYFIMTYLSKGQDQGEMFQSRADQLGNLWSNFLKNPLFGNGFSVPVLPFKSYEFSTEFIVEPGNLVLAVLSYSGVIGFLVFLFYLIQIFKVNRKNLTNILFLLIAPILICMGEMVFFSSNNIGIWCYMFLAMGVFLEKKDLTDIKKLSCTTEKNREVV